MEKFDLNNIFQGISTLLQSDPAIMYARIGLILLGILLVYLGRRGVLEPLVMIPMGLGMAAVNAGVLIFPGGTPGNLFLDPMVTDTDALMNILQIDFLQPVYTFTFSNGLIACLIFMGIGTMLDINFLLAKPLQSMFLALCAELGTFAVVPIAYAMGLSPSDSASIAMVGGADGPMVLFASLNLSKEIFVPITVVAYLYLGLTYGGYPYLVRAMVPKRLRAIRMKPPKQYGPATKISFAVVMCVILCLLFPVAAPLFFSLFIGIVIKESGLRHVNDFISGPMLYGSTFFLGILLGILCDGAQTARAGHPRLADFGHRRHLGRLCRVFLQAGQLQPRHRHRGRELRPDDGQGGAEDRLARQSVFVRAGRRAWSQRHGGHHLGRHRRDLRDRDSDAVNAAGGFRPAFPFCGSAPAAPICGRGGPYFFRGGIQSRRPAALRYSSQRR